MEVAEESKEKVYDGAHLQQKPQYPGGTAQRDSFISRHLQYPAQAKQQGIEGTVVVAFVVDADGDITDIKVKRSVSPQLDKEAQRIIKQMPDWKPGRKNGKAVPVRVVLPIKFEL
jgi:protein TonB